MFLLATHLFLLEILCVKYSMLPGYSLVLTWNTVCVILHAPWLLTCSYLKYCACNTACSLATHLFLLEILCVKYCMLPGYSLVLTWKTRGLPDDLLVVAVVVTAWWGHEWRHVQLLWEWHKRRDLLMVAGGMLKSLKYQNSLLQKSKVRYQTFSKYLLLSNSRVFNCHFLKYNIKETSKLFIKSFHF